MATLGTRGFSRVRREFSLAVGRSHERRSLTETGNRARKVSGTQGTRWPAYFSKYLLTMQRYNPTFLKPVFNRGRTSSVSRALYSRVGGRWFDSPGRANNQALNLNDIKTLYNGIL